MEIAVNGQKINFSGLKISYEPWHGFFLWNNDLFNVDFCYQYLIKPTGKLFSL
jgi:hypothetical protein